MAEFKLGRIRFVWKGAWVTGTPYYKDDVVRFGGKVYVCQSGHTASLDFNTDLNIVPSKWNLMSDGQRWTGDWTTATPYEEGDLAKYGGTVYLCTSGHTSAATAASGLEANYPADWDIFVEGFDWKNDWTTATRYKYNDIVRYGGIDYVCQTGHTSAATAALGLENDIGNWQVFSQGQEYLGTWTTSTRYKVNDIVKWGAGLWICTTQHTSNSFPTDSSYWSQYTKGFEFESTWSGATAYQPGDIVIYGGNRYVAKTLNTNSNPLTGTSDWDLFSQGLSYQSTWTNTTSYKIGQVVQYGGYNYLATTDSPSLTFTVTAAQASNDQFTIASTTGIVANMSVRFTGTTFGGVNTGGRYYVKTVGAGYITISTTPGGSTFNVTLDAVGSMTATISAEPPNSSYWVDISHGINWRGTWADDTEYNVGDAVRLNSNAYYCVQSHRAEGDDGSTLGVEGGGQSLSRPDLDASGTYWNVLTVGSETSVLTTTGDMVYYGGAGPTRLPVGSEGQVLRVSAGGIPEWVTWGKVDHVYYVATTGDDRPYPDCGASLDKPWASIRYACQEIEKGALNPQAKKLLELNRVFIQREVTAWIRYQITNNISPFTTTFDYDEYKCERDVGFIVDRLIWDISHGGNLKTLAAALSYINALDGGSIYATAEDENGTGTYTKLSTEGTKDVAAYNYMEEVIYAVLANESPTTVYQTLALDSTAIVTQTIDTDYTTETGVEDRVAELVGIVTTALTDQVTTNLPDRLVPNNTIFVKTGTYYETLPIVVPAETALVGDEVRSVHVSPADSLIHITDAKYTVGSFGRMETVLGQIILGTNVTESTGNTATQSADFPFASSVEVTSLQQLVRAAKYKTDWNLGTMISASYPDPTGYNVSFLAGYGDARKLLIENKKFIQEEIIAWLEVNYPTLKYGKTDTRQDIGYIIDAMVYDLTYGDSYQSIVAGLAYFDGDFIPLLPASILGATVASQGRLKTVMQQIVANTTVTKSTGNNETQWKDTVNLTGGSSASSFIGTNMDIITNLVGGDSTSGNPPSINITTIATNNTFTTGSAHGLAVGDTVKPRITANGLVADTIYWVKSVPLSTTFTLAASYDGTTLASFTNGTGLDIDADVMFMPTTSWVSAGLVTAWTTLSAAMSTIKTNTVSYVTTNYPTLVYDTTKTARDVELVLTAAGYDFMFGGNYATLKAAYAYLRTSDSEILSNQTLKNATRAALTYAKTQAKSNVGGNATAQASLEANMTMVDDIIFGGSFEGSICQTELRAADYARLQLERNRDYIVSEISAWTNSTYQTSVTSVNGTTDVYTCSDTSWMQRNTAVKFTGTVFGGISANTVYYVQNVISSTTFTISDARDASSPLDLTSGSGTMTVSMYYPQATCERDVGEFIDAFKYDLQYPGNYATVSAVRLYTNAVIGNKEENMFLLRNGTGVRNFTLEGLNGDLTPENDYGTSRTTAGAYCSLDPGWGPADFRTWIVARSPYVQNVCTFGYAAIGQKIDGALHNGGNRSIVSNDFTQLISDGIGAWVTNNARAELVSVFTYYSHVGYLSENGGRIRGTNGNNSYGDFGSVAEGYDADETPILAEVDNKAFTVEVGSILTDGIDKLYQYEYDNAGLDYTQVSWSISGGGAGVSVEHTDFRDGGVYQVRLIDSVDDSAAAPEVDGNYGGFGYISSSNTAQGGTTSAITLAATDDEITGAYVGMKVIVTGGTGAGQVGIVDTYTAGTKVATVTKESTGGAGWDHIVPGTTIVAPDASSTYIVEPRITFTGPTYSSASRTLGSAQTYTTVHYSDTYGVYTPITSTGGTGTSAATFTVVRKGVKYSAVVIVSAGVGYTRLDTLTLAGSSLGGASTTNDITITVTAVDSTTGAIQAFEYTGTGVGGKFAAVASGSRDVNTSTNGTSWTSNSLALPSTSSWSSTANGALTVIETAGSFVVGRGYVITSLGNTVFTSIGAAANLVGTYFVATGSGSGTGTATPIANHLVAVSSSTTVNAYSLDGGVTWSSGGALPAGISGTAQAVAYGLYNGTGTWVVIGSTGATAYSTNGGISWIAGGALPAGTWTAVAYGAGRWVAISTGGTATAYSTNGGQTWTTGGLLASSTWVKIAYGENKFVAVSSDGTVNPYYTVDGGVTWSTTGVTGWLNQTVTNVKYGQGIFVATNSTSNDMVSSEDGIVWTTRAVTRASGTGVRSATFGNPSRSGVWAIIPSASTTAASSAVLGSTAKARAYVAENKIYAIRVTDPGSSYSSAPTMTITDPNNLYEAPFTVRTGNGICAQPDFINRGTGYDSALATIDTGDGYANNFQNGQYVAVRRLTGSPEAGANVVFATQPDTVYKLVQVISPTGSYDGARGAFLQISPNMSIYNSPADATGVTTRIRYSQVRLTGHDFLDIGTGNFDETNYPNGEPENAPNQLRETADLNGGRVFYTSTDQDGNFRVGELFVIEQATGKATLNADAFNIAGLTQLSLGNITLGGNSATITEFSTDPFLTANSDSVVSTQKAIKAYIAAQIGGGGASLNVNSIVAGFIYIAGTSISTTTGGTIQMKANFNFQAGVRGYPVAWNYFLNN